MADLTKAEKATHHHDEPSKFLEPSKDTMTEEEGLKALASLSQQLGVKLPTRTLKTEEIDPNAQQAKEEMQRLLDQEQAQRNQQFKR